MEGLGLKTSKITSALIAAGLTVALIGCDAVGEQGQGSGGEPRQEQQSPAIEQPSGAAASGDVELPAKPGQPIAGQEVHNAGATLRIDLTGLKRTDRLITLSWTITVTKGGPDGTWQVGTKMSADQIYGYDVSGVSLVDPVHSKRHLVARNASDGQEQGPCVCSTTESSSLQAGGAVSFSATFTAPPPDVTKVNVDLVALGTFNDVPIS
jgi:hypothetical protein